MIADYGTPITYPLSFDYTDVLMEASCTLDYELICLAGCDVGYVPLHTFTPESITWNADTEGRFILVLEVFYDQYRGTDETGSFS